MKELSVIVPIYNRYKTMEICINSILQQTFENFEVLLIDDGSTDKSRELCQKFANYDSRVKFYVKTNGGVSSARNLGIEKAESQYLTFIDSDDYIPPNYFKNMIDVIEEYGGNAQPISPFVSFKTDEELQKIAQVNQLQNEVWDGNRILKLYEKCLLNSCVNKLYNNQVIKQYKIQFPEQVNIGEDLLFNLEYLRVNDIKDFIILENNFYYYRRSDVTSLNNRFHNNYYEIHEIIYEKLLELARQKQAPDEDYNIYWHRYWDFVERALDYTMRKDNPQFFYKKIKKNNKIMKSTYFKQYVSDHESSFQPYIRWAYKSQKYLAVYLIKKILSFYLKVKKRMKIK